MGFGTVKGVKGQIKGKAAAPAWSAPVQAWGKGSKAPAPSWGKGKGKAAAPAWSPPQQSWGKGFGKDKGKGKGKFTCAPNKKVWIGGLAEQEFTDKDLNKALQEHMKQAGDCKFVSIGKSGSGSACYTSVEEAEAAVALLNGSEFQGSVLEVDTWTKADGSAIEVKQCHAFQAGTCDRGDKCRYAHA